MRGSEEVVKTGVVFVGVDILGLPCIQVLVN